MAYTEEAAKQKWCPFARLGDCERGFGHNRWEGPDAGPPMNNRCLGSQCAAWRWDDEKRETMRFYKDDPRRDTYVIPGQSTLRIIDGEPWRYEYTDCDEKGEFDLLHRAKPENGDNRKGYCGLAGLQS